MNHSLFEVINYFVTDAGKGREKFTPVLTTFGSLPSLKKIKYIRMHHFKKLNSKIFSPDRPHENVLPRHHCGS